MKQISYVFLFIFFLSSAYAITCYDSFDSTQEIIQICGYCEELNGTTCSQSTQCNFTIYYSNYSLYGRDLIASNYGDGSIVYNITQQTSNGKNLSDGTYIGEMFCGPRSRDNLIFTVGTPTKLGAAFGGSYVEKIIEVRNGELILTNQTRNRIKEDVDYYLEWGASKLPFESRILGKIIIISTLLFLIFMNDLYRLVKRIKVKKEW